MSNEIVMRFDIDNLGPLNHLVFQDIVKSFNTAIFAENGMGKTFISRAFRLCSIESNIETTNKLLTLKKAEGHFIFKIQNSDDTIKPERNLEITFRLGQAPVINNDTGYIFYVYNHDFVAENLESCSFNPEGDIQGYILGKENIDVAKDRKELELIQNELIKVKNYIGLKINEAKTDLDGLQISKKMNEYKLLNFENVITSRTISENESFEELKNEHSKLKSIPEDINDVPTNIYFSISYNFLKDIKRELLTAYTRSVFEEDFLQEIRSDQTFFENGIKRYNANKEICPFCKQSLTDNAIIIIEKYDRYINDQEAQIIKAIETLKSELISLTNNIQSYCNNIYSIKKAYDNLKQYFPSFKDEELITPPDTQQCLKSIEKLKLMLNKKEKDISNVDFEPNNCINLIEQFIAALKNDMPAQILEINKLNQAKNNSGNEKLKLNRRLCNARKDRIIICEKNELDRFDKLKKEIIDKKESITKKEEKNKTSKKRKVVDMLESLLEFFFDNKYSFDENNFCLKYKDISLLTKTDSVLSEGEKGIIAFCYYLSMTYSLVKNEEDLKNIFFIIDDPISSMDFNHVYKIAQIIRNINDYFDKKSYDRFIILTHNLEFMNILIRNKIINQRYILVDHQIKRWDRNLALPYESHLKNIVQVANREIEPSYTIPNSIRHVLETICRFESPNKNIKEFIESKPELKESQYIYSLMQDLSHGGIRFEPPLESETLVKSCCVVRDYINKYYKDQIVAVSIKK